MTNKPTNEELATFLNRQAVIYDHDNCLNDAATIRLCAQAIRDVQNKPDAIPDEISEWIYHLDMHLTEHDTHHAGLALRAAWPEVRDFFMSLLPNKQAEEGRAGCVNVPREPTEKMIRAALDCQDADPEDGHESEVYYMYMAMIKAAEAETK